MMIDQGKPRVIVSGSLAYDRIMDFPGRFRDHILPDKVHMLNVSFAVPGLTEHYGGTAGNIAYTFALLGGKPAVVAAVGGDFVRYRQWLRRHGVNLAGVRVVARERTAAAHIITDSDDNQITGFHLGAMGQRGAFLSPSRLRQAAAAIVAPGNIGDMLALPRRYRQAGVPYWFDPGQQLTSLTGARVRQALSGAQGLFVNDYELALTLKKTGWSMRQALARGVTVVTTLGPKGSVVRHGAAVVRAPAARPRAVVDPTGAGDAYRAGFLRAWLLQWPISVAARFAGVVAAYTVERSGTQTHRFSCADLRRRYRKNFGRELPRWDGVVRR